MATPRIASARVVLTRVLLRDKRPSRDDDKMTGYRNTDGACQSDESHDCRFVSRRRAEGVEWDHDPVSQSISGQRTRPAGSLPILGKDRAEPARNPATGSGNRRPALP